MSFLKTCGLQAATVVLAILIFGAIRAHAAVLIGYDPYSNSNLYLVGSTATSSTWLNAEAQAQALGGNLVTIHSSAENQFVSNTFFTNLTGLGGPNLSTAYALWMGLSDPTGAILDDGPGGPNSQHAANFVWADGEHSSYRNWDVFEPNDGNGGSHEYYAGLWGPDAQIIVEGGVATPLGSWNDFPNLYPGPAVPSQGFYGIAAVPVPEPASIGLLGLGAILIVRRRWRVDVIR